MHCWILFLLPLFPLAYGRLKLSDHGASNQLRKKRGNSSSGHIFMIIPQGQPYLGRRYKLAQEMPPKRCSGGGISVTFCSEDSSSQIVSWGAQWHCRELTGVPHNVSSGFFLTVPLSATIMNHARSHKFKMAETEKVEQWCCCDRPPWLQGTVTTVSLGNIILREQQSYKNNIQ